MFYVYLSDEYCHIFGSCYDDDDEGFIIGFAHLLFGYMICFYFKIGSLGYHLDTVHFANLR